MILRILQSIIFRLKSLKSDCKLLPSLSFNSLKRRFLRWWNIKFKIYLWVWSRKW